MLFLQGCQKPQSENLRLINDSQDQLLCETNFDEFNNRIYDFWLQEKNPPSSEELKKQIYLELQKNKSMNYLTEEEQAKISSLISRYYQFLTETLTTSLSSSQEKLNLLTALELGDQSGEKQKLQMQWEAEKKKFADEIASMQLALSSLCAERKNKENSDNQNTNPPAPSDGSDSSREIFHPSAIDGLHKVIATAYQTCEALEVKPLSAQTPNIQGIKILSEGHASGRGRKRVYQDVQKIFKTNPYYAINTPLQKGCFANTKQPLIYDFGGKPKTTTDANSVLDFFTDAGSGTDVLGIDCSGFIFSAIARGGLKLSPNKTLKAVLVHGMSANMFKNPSKNGMTCFESLVDLRTTTLQPGDIIASDAHVVMVGSVGLDPFGIKRAKKVSDCTIDKLSSNGFDFAVSQSGNWKNGIGIHQSEAKDYLKSTSTFQKGLTQLAQYFCQEKFSPPKTSQDPSSLAKPTLDGINVIRHKGTAECLAQTPIALKYESCVEDCQSNY